MTWDLFISHASEDKADVARPLADMLQAKGFKVWYDEYTLTLGDNLRRSIEQGLARSQFAVVILSPSFFAKKWTNLELDGLFALEQPGVKRILPVWHNVTAGDVESFSSFMAMRLGVPTSKGMAHVVEQIDHAVRREREGATDSTQPAATLTLHPHSIALLMAAKEGDGSIMAASHLGGLSVSAGSKSFGVDGDPRNEALNLHCLDELVANGFAKQSGESLYELTQEGFDYEVPAGVDQAPQPVFATLTSANEPQAKEIMKAAVAGNGIVMLVGYMGGDTLQAGGSSWESGCDRRTVARWKSVLRELVNTELLLQTSEDNYQVSHMGYLWTDSVNVGESQDTRSADSATLTHRETARNP